MISTYIVSNDISSVIVNVIYLKEYVCYGDDTLKITLAQIYAHAGDVKYNTKKIEKLIKKTKSDLIIFPELATTSYIVEDEIYHLAMDINNKWFTKISQICKKMNTTAIFGFPEKDNNIRGWLYNSACIIMSDGKIDVYRKCYLPNFGPFHEKYFFKNGTHQKNFFISHNKVGVSICYDIFFPEFIKMYALNGVDILVCISASPTFSKELFESVLRVRAIENTIFVIYVNLIGNIRKLSFWGGSRVISPSGSIGVKAKYFDEDIVDYEINTEEIPQARRLRPTLRDTLPIDGSSWTANTKYIHSENR